MIIREYGSDLCLLKHEFGDEDCVRIAGPPPGKIPPMIAIPANKRAAECVNGLWRSHDLERTSNAERSTSNAEFRVED